MSPPGRPDPSWPQDPVIYQIYPRSFRDSTGSGEGDLRGVVRGLDHVARLGVDAIWLAPFFRSPMCDGGYDIADHCTVDPRFGTLDDFDAVVARAHALGLRVMIDQVFNHTSQSHPWFRASCLREDPFTDFYIWADPCPDGSPPSNWLGFFGHPGWKWIPSRRQYCLHQFLPCQPCLNHHDPRMRAEQDRILSFWRDRGVDGFRFDAVTAFFHDPGFRDNPPDPTLTAVPANPYRSQRHLYDMMPDDCAAHVEGLRRAAGPHAYLLGEINRGEDSYRLAAAFTGPGRLDATYTMDIPEGAAAPAVLDGALRAQCDGGGQAFWLASHDQPRMIDRGGDGSARDARLFAALHLGLPGPLLIYQGEEIGQRQATLDHDTLRDPYDRRYWPDVPGRDGARVPLPWDEEAPHAGFGAGAAPWLPVGTAEDGGIAQQARSDSSVLAFYRRALALRRDLGLGRARTIPSEVSPDWFAARIVLPDGREGGLCANFSETRRTLPEGLRALPAALASAGAPDGQIAPRSAVWLVQAA